MKSLFKNFILLITLGTSLPVFAGKMYEEAHAFHNIFLSCVGESSNPTLSRDYLHFVPNSELEQALSATTLQGAMDGAHGISVDDLWSATQKSEAMSTLDLDHQLRRHPVTLVLVPGIFGEFIQTRAFEEVLSEPSRARDEFIRVIEQAKASLDLVKQNAAWSTSFSMSELKQKSVRLDEVVHVGSIQDKKGEPLVKVVLLYTPRASLETLGDLTERAALLRTRLEQYLSLMGPENIVLVGYSRGTTYALEMLAQAQELQSPLLTHAKAMVALNGVIWGSSTADQLDDETNSMAQTVHELLKLAESLEPLQENSGLWDRLKVIRSNTQAWRQFLHKMVELNTPKNATLEPLAQLLSGQDPFKKSFYSSVLALNMQSEFVFFFQALLDTNVGYLVSEYSQNIRRAKAFISSALTGIDQLRTARRMEWWKNRSHYLPTQVHYYSIQSAMVDPRESDLSARIFASPWNFANQSFEDMYLLQNRKAYYEISGLRLNDSQVGVPQAAFLPSVVHSFTGKDSLHLHYLGVLGTHHWGDVLRIVFSMKDQRTNGFPRSALAKALAAQVAFDLEAQ